MNNIKYNHMKKIIYSLLALTMLFVSSCTEDDLEPTLAQSKAVETSINTVEDMQGIALGMYNRFTATSYYGRDLIIFGEVRSDNCFSNGNSGRFVTAADMKVSPDDGYSEGPWTSMYAVIASANILIGLNAEEIEGDATEKNHILGQAYLARALAHFDLLKLYGQQHAGGNLGVPYVTTYKGDVESLSPARNTVDENKASIMGDIDMAASLMTASLNDPSKQFLTTHSANALKARVALYFKDWSTAKSAAQAVVNSGAYEIIEGADYSTSFLVDGAKNSIFELAYSSTDNNNINGLQYIYRGSSYGDIQALEDLYLAFDDGDVRAAADMIGPDPDVPSRSFVNLGKYPSYDYSDNIPIIRYEEVILILAEAKIELGEGDALDVLNMVPAKRNAQPHAAATKANVLLERRRELCFEGFRFNDLARTGSNIPVVSEFEQTHGGPSYGSYNYAFPIPTEEMNANPEMVQNNNY
jgi:hypothetical protein